MKTKVQVAIGFEVVSSVDIARSKSSEYLVWTCAEDKDVCEYCGMLNYKIVRARDLAALGYPPAHVDCPCKLVTIEQRYGEPKPVIYYCRLPCDYQTWVEEGRQDFRLIRVFL